MSRLTNACDHPQQFTASDNPFRTCRVESTIQFQPEWLGTSWQEILERFNLLRQTRSKCTVVGPHGTGKTTFFDAFERRLKKRGHEVLRLALHLTIDGKSELPTVPGDVSADTIVLLDSAGVVGWRIWNPMPRAVVAGLATVRAHLGKRHVPSNTRSLATSATEERQHRKHWREQVRRIAHCQIVETRHRRSKSPILLQTDSTPTMLQTIVRRLDPEWQISRDEIGALFLRHKGNIRESLRECYDLRAAK